MNPSKNVLLINFQCAILTGMMHRCACAMSFNWNGISIWHLVLWCSNQVNGPLLIWCILLLLIWPSLICVILPEWWGQLLLHNKENYIPPLYIFSVFRWKDRVVALIVCRLNFGFIIWSSPFLRCMLGACWIVLLIFIHGDINISWNRQCVMFVIIIQIQNKSTI